MHYFNVDGQSDLTVSACIAKLHDLLTLQGKKVAICTDVGVGYNALFEERELWLTLTHPEKSNEAKIAALLDARSKFYKETLLPGLGEYEIILVRGGIIHDMRWMDYRYDSFQTVLRENLEMLQSLGGVAYPAGVILADKLGEDCIVEDYAERFSERACRMGDAMSRFKCLHYTLGEAQGWEVAPLLNS